MKQQTATITVQATVNAPVEKVWKTWTNVNDIIKWNTPSPDWHTPRAEHDVKPGGKFLFRMEAKDGSFGFDFGGVYDVVDTNKCIEYTIGDGRKVKNTFDGKSTATEVVVTFEAETEHSMEMQRGGWQAILDSFKNYTETV